ncbi:LPS assembly lipoprotein LptE [uncultured Aliiroseovarius sp.]|uniref:LPS assembly lipoprotein LptE n=1 Tax=uncultured Aliiroseovarius sp. TaxID=1658783 RepID=UPI002606B242|nr:LPS assembly lipoprotein LptE [uncultured Aliiroseovarius sp.]
MSWSDRRHFLKITAAAALLAGCGFTPVYAPGGSADGLRGAVTIAAPNDSNSYEFVKRMEERLGRNLSAPYRLDYTITTRSEGVGVTPAQEITRTQVLGAVEFSVTSVATGDVVEKGTVSNFTSYSTEGSTVSTAAVERDANRRLMVLLADQITTRFSATFSGWGE